MVIPFDPSTLNPQQRLAVEWPGGPIMILAGAGSGKTRVITCRIARLIAEGVAPYRILSVTFTNKAAKEMRERIEEMVGSSDARSLWMGTFHSICARMLRMEGKAIGIDPSFVVYDDGDQLTLIKDILKAQNLDDKAFQPRGILSEISRAKEKMVTPEVYKREAATFFEQRVAEIYPVYQNRLTKASALDFDDILYYAVKLLEDAPEVRQKYQQRFQHVLIDEYQDVNFTQYRFAQLIGEGHRNLTIVGDDDQSIYGWRGADVSLMLRFGSDYPDAKIITLDQNYRSTKKILDAAFHVIKHNRSRTDKRLWTENNDGQLIIVKETGSENDEAMAVADLVLSHQRRTGRKFGEYAVLYRTNAMSRAFEEAFLTMRVPHILVGGVRFYERKEVKDLIGYLRVVQNPNDTISLKRILNTPTRGIGATTVGKLEGWATKYARTAFEALSDQELQIGMTTKTRGAVQSFVGLIEDARQMADEGQPVTAILKHLLKYSGYEDELRAERTEESISRLENLQELVNVTTTYDASDEEGRGLFGFLESVSLISDIDTLTETGEAVTLMTLHSSKGLEFPVVFLVGMEENVFPHSRAQNDPSELEEERRLAYVGITRAREELIMTHARRRTVFGSANFNRRSRFLDDIPEDLLQLEYAPGSAYGYESPVRSVRSEREGGYQVINKAVREEPEEVFTAWEAPFKVGQRVTHAKFGIGIVIACAPLKNDCEVTVTFPGVIGTKKMVQSFAKLVVIE
ncbi:MAG: UvrD-helicase domain-containing protein [Chthonomonas sp.]|nr:UvrD-helicase domain-containing protein [Chthonomonas sp.]